MHPFHLAEDVAWSLVDLLITRPGRKLFEARSRRLSKRIWLTAQDKGVLSGPFEGLAYSCQRAFGSALLPKLLGTYESELHSTIKAFSEQNYISILDIGAAEGYYAVGLARLFPTTSVVAFDTNPTARQLCHATIETNNVADRVTVDSLCDPERLESLVKEKRCLIVSDCEGFEAELFTTKTSQSLKMSDLIIETHDFLTSGITDNIVAAVSDTHFVEVIEAKSDDDKAKEYVSPTVCEFDYWLRRRIFAEKRPSGMKWLVCRSRSAS